MELKKSYRGFAIWLVIFCLLSVGICFLPEMETQYMIAIVDNFLFISVVVLTLIIYKADRVYWYTGVSYEQAAAVSKERRMEYGKMHLKRFGIAAVLFLVYSIISILVGIPYGVDITVALVLIVGVALSTIRLKL